jgi:capsular polysaccharide transport system ATP-binding protein
VIVLDNVTLPGAGVSEQASVLDRVSVSLTPGIVHIEAEHAADRNRFIDLLAGRTRPKEGVVRARGRVSWPLGEVRGFWSRLTGYQSIDFFCSAFNLDRGDTFRFFHEIMDEPEWLKKGIDTWSRSALTQFMHASYIAPQFDVYLIRSTPVLPQQEFFLRWKLLFLHRVAGKTVIMGTGHRAARTAFPGEVLWLRSGKLHRETIANQPA